MDTKSKSTVAELISLWAIQESLLQQYRTIFITMQSIFIAIGAAVLDAKDPWVPMVLLTLLGVSTVYLWVSICSARGEVVYFAQYLVMRAEQGDPIFEPLARLKHFQSDTSSADHRDPRFMALHGGATRWKMERLLPFIFLAAWTFLWAILVSQHYNVAFLPRAAG